jgi:hypothetical protein
VDDGPRRGGISKRGQRDKYNNKNIHVVLPEEDEEMGGQRRGEQAGTARPRGFRYYPATLLHRYTTTLLHCDTATLLHCYTATLLHCYTATLLHCYTATLLLGAQTREVLDRVGCETSSSYTR